MSSALDPRQPDRAPDGRHIPADAIRPKAVAGDDVATQLFVAAAEPRGAYHDPVSHAGKDAR